MINRFSSKTQECVYIRRITCLLLLLHAFCGLQISAKAGAEDCNSNGIENATEIAAGTSADCDSNGLLNVCEYVLFVDDSATNGLNNGTSWGNAFIHLQDALATADSDCTISQIWVAAGIYKPDQGGGQTRGDRNATFHLQNNLAIYGGFSGTEESLLQRDLGSNGTTLSGDLLGDDMPDFHNYCENSLHVVSASAVNSSARIDGLTIVGGNADEVPLNDSGSGMINDLADPVVIDCDFRANLGMSGVAMANYGSSPVLSRCTFEGNKAIVSGLAMYNVDQSNPMITDCVFATNIALQLSAEPANAGGIHNSNSHPSISNCVFTHSGPISGYLVYGVLNDSSSPSIVDSDFVNNSIGIENTFESGPTIERCRFVRNRKNGIRTGGSATLVLYSEFIANSGSGIFNGGGQPVIANCTFNGNGGQSFNIGGISNSQSDAIISNCTFSGSINDFSNTPGPAILCVFNSNPQISNCVLWDNGAAPISALLSSDPVVNHSVVQGGWAGAGGLGIIDADPLYVDSTGPDGIAGNEDDDLRLLPRSPAIDAGDNSAVPVGVLTDLDGHARFVDDVLTTDSGAGIAPIVDIGAYEFVLGDCDADGDADLDDLAILAGCLTNPGDALGVGCACLDLDSDFDVDLRDFARFQFAF